jgi:hypothetical protein
VGGFGRVRSVPKGLVCGVDFLRCRHDFGSGRKVQLVAVPGRGAVFAGWGGSCHGLGACRVTAHDLDVTALFRPGQPPGEGSVRLSVRGSGPASVRSSFPGIVCPPTCAADVPAGTTGTLTASAFDTSWRGACVGAVSTCPVTLDRGTIVTARSSGHFNSGVPPTTLPFTDVGISVMVSGRGRVLGRGVGIDCRVPDGSIDGCRGFVGQTNKVVLVAIPKRGSRFDRWTGDCATRRNATKTTCSIDAFDSVSVNAIFGR